MLASADVELVRRDPGLPGLAALLDAEALAGLLDGRDGVGTVRAVTPRYVRYKPRTSCLVGYRVDADGGVWDAYAKAHRAGVTAKAEKMVDLRHPADGPTPVAPAPVRLGAETALVFFPHDRRLRAARRLAGPGGASALLAAALPERLAEDAALVPLRYKPERRWIARVDGPEGPRALLKCYAAGDYAQAERGARAFADVDALRVSTLVGRSRRDHVLALGWIDGACLSDLLAAGPVPPALLEEVGRALAAVHSSAAPGVRDAAREGRGRAHVRRATHEHDVRGLSAAAAAVRALLPGLGDRADGVARAVRASVTGHPVPSHGDFSADQVLVADRGITLIDFDQARLADPVGDLGLFAATLERDAMEGALDTERVAPLVAAVVRGYRAAGGGDHRDRLAAATAGRLLRLAAEPFRYRRPCWPERVGRILDRAAELAR